MRKAGRPKVPKDKAFVPGVSVRLTANDRKTIDTAIKESGISQSEWARKALIYVAERGIKMT
jgi:hypothetical protein